MIIGFFPRHGLDDGGWIEFRCYQDSILGLFQYVSYPCDSTWTMRVDNINDSYDQHLHLYPNPVEQQLSISIEESTPLISAVQLYDIRGQNIYQQAFVAPKREWTLDMRAHRAGIYLLEVQLLSGKRLMRKVWKR